RPEAVELTAPAAPAAAATAGVGEHVVLYVEDNLTTVSLVERIVALRPAITLVSAMQGSLAIDLARQHKPRLIVLDVHLPDMTGDEVLERLKQDEATKSIPVI